MKMKGKRENTQTATILIVYFPKYKAIVSSQRLPTSQLFIPKALQFICFFPKRYAHVNCLFPKRYSELGRARFARAELALTELEPGSPTPSSPSSSPSSSSPPRALAELGLAEVTRRA